MTSPPPEASPVRPEGRPSAVDPARTLERRVPPFFALFFYGFPAAASWVLLHNTRDGGSAQLWSLPDPVRSLLYGTAVASILLAVRAVALRTVRAARSLESEFGWIVGRQRKGECLLLAALSAAAEEYFFRGWMQATLGLWIAAAVFAVLHWPVNRNFLLWPPFAFGAGLLFGWITHRTGNLHAAVAAHALYNAVALWRVTDRFRDWDPDAVERYLATGRAA